MGDKDELNALPHILEARVGLRNSLLNMYALPIAMKRDQERKTRLAYSGQA